MARYESSIIPVSAEDRDELVDAIARVAAAGDGWINVEPSVDDDDRTEVPGIFAWFSARGPQVPVGTFVAGTDRDPASVGLAHGSGRGAADRLVDAGVTAPGDWVARQDHAKHGLVWEIHPQRVDAPAVATLLTEGTVVLSTLPTTGGWVATVHEPR